jgi:hypothetical protein
MMLSRLGYGADLALDGYREVEIRPDPHGHSNVHMGGIDAARITREKLGPECPAAEPAVHLAVEYSIEFSSPRLRQKDRGSRSALAV